MTGTMRPKSGRRAIPHRRRGPAPDKFEWDDPSAIGATRYPTREWEEWIPAASICERCLDAGDVCLDHDLTVQKLQFVQAGHHGWAQILRRAREHRRNQEIDDT